MRVVFSPETIWRWTCVPGKMLWGLGDPSPLFFSNKQHGGNLKRELGGEAVEQLSEEGGGEEGRPRRHLSM